MGSVDAARLRSSVPHNIREEKTMPKIIIIGGGIAGLAAAVHLKAGAKAYDKTVEVLLLEKNGRIGGQNPDGKAGQVPH